MVFPCRGRKRENGRSKIGSREGGCVENDEDEEEAEEVEEEWDNERILQEEEEES